MNNMRLCALSKALVQLINDEPHNIHNILFLANEVHALSESMLMAEQKTEEVAPLYNNQFIRIYNSVHSDQLT